MCDLFIINDGPNRSGHDRRGIHSGGLILSDDDSDGIKLSNGNQKSGLFCVVHVGTTNAYFALRQACKCKHRNV